MAQRPLYVGIDLGTTNSAIALFDGERTHNVRNAQGNDLTPSVVRIDARGRVTIGAGARRFLDRDPDNTASEFKRLMGTGREVEFVAAGVTRKPEELAAEVLRSLRNDVRDQAGVLPEAAVIAVPALFELPQNAATSTAGSLAGFSRVELLPEPVASALAAGWTSEAGDGRWLVYDLGGGTFDASLLANESGFLRVVGHDGDNFLGGRDFDWAIVDWMIAQIERIHGVAVRRSDPTHASAVALLKATAEDAKIQLSRADEVELALAMPLQVPGEVACAPELVLHRTELDSLITPVIERSIDVCKRLLHEHRVEPSSLARIVFVGGPTSMPLVRERVGAALPAPIAEGLDPMTLVAQGAAIYAATAGLDARPAGPIARRGCRLWLQYPAVSSDLSPHVAGKLVEVESGPRPVRLRLVRDDGWTSEDVALDSTGAFVTMVELRPRIANAFEIVAEDTSGTAISVQPAGITIVQGLTITDPPLSRSVGVALANGAVQLYFDRGTPLPAKRTFTLQTVETVARGATEHALKIPIVQGEYERAHLCRLIGSLEIAGASLSRSLPAGSDVEVTIELDRGGRLSARALAPAIDQVFESVAHLLVPAAEPHALQASFADLRQRLDDLRAEAFRRAMPQLLTALERVETDLAEISRDLGAAQGGNEDAGQRARRNLLELNARLDEVEASKHWPELEHSTVVTMTWATRWVADLGTDRERALFEEVAGAVAQARSDRNVRELQRQLRLANQLGETAWYRDPGTWPALFDDAASRIDNATDLPRAQALVREGKQAIVNDDLELLRRVTEKLWRLLPHDPAARQRSFDSGVR